MQAGCFLRIVKYVIAERVEPSGVGGSKRSLSGCTLLATVAWDEEQRKKRIGVASACLSKGHPQKTRKTLLG